MHVQNKLGPKKGFKPSVCKVLQKIPRTDQGRHCRERHNQLILEECNCHLWREEECHALPHKFVIQPKVCRSVQPYKRPTNLPFFFFFWVVLQLRPPAGTLQTKKKKEERGLKQRRKQKEAAQGDPEPKKGNQEKEKKPHLPEARS